ncbi:MAG: 16S rRNA (cytosine(1402)-N(4))-methyltransferase RsmH [Acidobacteriales bacterium]|nr:16S rRNA (cytosine(1402)-N(4))-methyltransferase RsmH [Terriglobales bacterium]
MAKREKRVSRRQQARESAEQRSQVPASGEQGSEGHVSVLLQETIQFLNVRRGGSYADATLGLGGHSVAVARRLGAGGTLFAFDRDAKAIAIAQSRFERLREELADDMPEIRMFETSFSKMAEVISPGILDGLCADFGVSSLQLDDAARGFSFRAEGPLDMRMSVQEERTADQVVNRLDEHTLAQVIYELGEERRSRRIARAIVRARPIRSTAHLAEIVAAAAPANKRFGAGQARRPIHPATKTFQAIRMFVNRELEEVEALLNQAPMLLKPGGRLVAISFHSLEDRRVKDHMRQMAAEGIYEVLTKKPITASEQELERNSRARSAKLRCGQKR